MSTSQEHFNNPFIRNELSVSLAIIQSGVFTFLITFIWSKVLCLCLTGQVLAGPDHVTYGLINIGKRPIKLVCKFLKIHSVVDN